MNEAAAEVLALLRGEGWQALLVFLRVGAFASFMPGFGEQSVPVRVKLMAALCLTAVTFAALPEPPQPPATPEVFVLYLGTETVSGLALGIGLRLFVLGLQTTGSMIAQATSLSQILGPLVIEPMPAIGNILVIGGLALAMVLGLHVHAVLYLLISYEAMAPGQWPAAADLSEWGLALVTRSFRLAYSLAAPFIIISLIYNLTLGVINRAMPQLMVAFVGAPVITFGGMALLFLLGAQILSTWADAILAFLAAPF